MSGSVAQGLSTLNIVKLKGLPFKASAGDIAQFFCGFSLDPVSGVLLKRCADGRPNGEAYVVFTNQEDAKNALSKDRATFGERFGDRYVRVYPALEADLADVTAAVTQVKTFRPQESVVKVKSLPFEATQLDLIQFFHSFSLKPDGVQLVLRSDCKSTGEAFVDFESPAEAARAILEKDQQVFSEKYGSRYVRLVQVSREDMHNTLALRFGGEGIMKMKGIPFKASFADIRKFFVGYKIKEGGIGLIMRPDGRPSGMAFIEFGSGQEALRAMEKDRTKFGTEYGDRFCMLQLVGRQETTKVTVQKEPHPAEDNLVNENLKVLQAAIFQAAVSAQAAVLANTSLLGDPLMHGLLMNSLGMAGLPNISGAIINPGLGFEGLGHLSTCWDNRSNPMLDAMLGQLQLGAQNPLQNDVLQQVNTSMVQKPANQLPASASWNISRHSKPAGARASTSSDDASSTSESSYQLFPTWSGSPSPDREFQTALWSPALSNVLY